MTEATSAKIVPHAAIAFCALTAAADACGKGERVRGIGRNYPLIVTISRNDDDKPGGRVVVSTLDRTWN